MTVTDQIKILDGKIKSNQVQYGLGREAAKMSAMSSKELFEKYKYLTGEDLGNQAYLKKLNLRILYWVWFWLITLKTKRKQIGWVARKNKYLGYNSQHSFANFKNNDEFKELLLDSMYKKLNDFLKKINRLKNVTPQTDENKVLKLNVLDDTGDVFN